LLSDRFCYDLVEYTALELDAPLRLHLGRLLSLDVRCHTLRALDLVQRRGGSGGSRVGRLPPTTPLSREAVKRPLSVEIAEPDDLYPPAK